MPSTPLPPDQQPEFTVNPSTVQAMLVTAGSLLFFAVTFLTTFVGFVKTRDLVGLVNLIKSQETATGMTALAGAVWFVYRLIRTRIEKKKVVAIVRNVDDKVAMLTTEIGLSPLRARETETPPPPTRLVDAAALRMPERIDVRDLPLRPSPPAPWKGIDDPASPADRED